ncbi:flavodoxin I [Virgibacillus subterraneus]|uniref:Flavodoxin I n=2 Tax=Virgibacillus TaxID=84406 RepID=A0A1H0YYN8_9BACI|nr:MULTISPECIES: flavodoxin domain-containing protein [Virgibacillus]SDQ20208.1 flavodoxin I [Virgibacillus salinus]SEP83989.1 flavodoxin I [Virgibacillus subterraneus]
MARILVIYASLTGSTEIMAESIVEHIKDDHDVVVKTFDFDPIDAKELKNFDGILIGSYSWDDDIPFEVEGFHDDMDEVDLTGKLVGVFGSCDSYYDIYGPALDTMAIKAEKQNATVFEEKLKIELEPDPDDIKHCQRFADEFLKEIKK